MRRGRGRARKLYRCGNRIYGCTARLCCLGDALESEADSVWGVAVTLLLSDDDFAKLIAGKANAQKLFMSGKLKVRGDVMKATRMEPILKKAQGSSAKL